MRGSIAPLRMDWFCDAAARRVEGQVLQSRNLLSTSLNYPTVCLSAIILLQNLTLGSYLACLIVANKDFHPLGCRIILVNHNAHLPK